VNLSFHIQPTKEDLENTGGISPHRGTCPNLRTYTVALFNDLYKVLIVETYLKAYARYLELGSDWTW